MLPLRMCRPGFVPSPRAVNAAHAPPTHRWAATLLSGALGSGMASGRVLEPLNRVHGVNVTFFAHAPPFDSHQFPETPEARRCLK